MKKERKDTGKDKEDREEGKEGDEVEVEEKDKDVKEVEEGEVDVKDKDEDVKEKEEGEVSVPRKADKGKRRLSTWSIGSFPVSSRPLERDVEEEFNSFLGRILGGVGEPSVKEFEGVHFAVRRGTGFLISERMSFEGEPNPGVVEIMDYDPTTGRTLSTGKHRVPGISGLIWWGLRVFPQTNFAMLLHYRENGKEEEEGEEEEAEDDDEKEEGTEGPGVPEGPGSIGELRSLGFSPDVMIRFFSRHKDDRLEEERTRIDLSDGVLILSKELDGLLSLI